MLKLKNEEDIKRLRESGFILGSLYKEIIPLVQEEVSLIELDRWAESYIIGRKAKPAFKGYLGFPGTLCLSPNDIVIHGLPSTYKLKSTDILSIDCGVNLKGYYTDAAITIALSSAPGESKQLLSITEKALYAGINKSVVENRIRDIGQAISMEAKPYNYGIVYQYCGHGVGFSIHEDPSVPNLPEGMLRIQEGLVIAIEPMFNLGVSEVELAKDNWAVVTKDHKLSAHFEHTIAVTKNGPIVLTQVD